MLMDKGKRFSQTKKKKQAMEMRTRAVNFPGVVPKTYTEEKKKEKKKRNARRGARTHDPQIKSLMLYRLS